MGDLGLLVPEETECYYCGGRLADEDPVLHNWKAFEHSTIITNTNIFHVDIFYKPCTQCKLITIFEGQSKCLLNMGSYLVGYDVLRSYMHCFLNGRRPLYTFYNCFCECHLDYGNTRIKEELSYQKLRLAWNHFIKLINIDLNQGFSCPSCGGDEDTPNTIICDGTSFSFQKRMWNFKEKTSSNDALQLTSSSFSTQIFLKSAEMRKLLKRYASDGSYCQGSKQKVLDDSERKHLFSGIQDVSQSFHSILVKIEEDRQLLQYYQSFLLCLASPSPVCSYIKPSEDVNYIISSISTGKNVKEDPFLLTLIHEKIPLLFELFEKGVDVQDLQELLIDLWEIAVEPFKNSEDVTSLTDFVDDDDELNFFPSLRKYRNRGYFEMDKKNKRCRKGNEDGCCKKYSGHPSLLPGIFTIFCPHGICYGFQVMESNESPNVPFTILRTRFKKAPKNIIYDNACKLHQYCLSRDPLFFQLSEFYVDRLHWDNHTACSPAYNLAMYPQHECINSQANEQANAGLKRIKDQLSYMTAENFMTHCSFYLWNKNMCKKGCYSTS